jgi:hypothetical protein
LRVFGFGFEFQTAAVFEHSFAISPQVSREVCSEIPYPLEQRAQGKPGADCTHGSRAKKSTGVGPQVQPDQPAFPAQWFYGL